MTTTRLDADTSTEQPPGDVIARRSAPWIGRELIIRDSPDAGVAWLHWIRVERGPEVRVATVAYGPGQTPEVAWAEGREPDALAPDRTAIESWVAVEVASWSDRTVR